MTRGVITLLTKKPTLPTKEATKANVLAYNPCLQYSTVGSMVSNSLLRMQFCLAIVKFLALDKFSGPRIEQKGLRKGGLGGDGRYIYNPFQVELS